MKKKMKSEILKGIFVPFFIMEKGFVFFLMSILVLHILIFLTIS